MGPMSTSPSTVAFTVSAAVAIALVMIKRSKMTTMTKEKAIAAAGDPKLPDGFILDSFTNSRLQKLHALHLPRKDESIPAKAVLFLVHGVSEHCSRPGYIRLYQSLAAAGVDVFSLDLHGHGRSDGEPRGYTEKLDHHVDDIVQYIELVSKESYTDKGQTMPPLLLMGHSMGGLISILTLARLGNDRVAGLILSAPALGVDMNLELRIQQFFAPIINALIPKARIVDAVNPWDMSRNKDAVQEYIDDPLNNIGKLVARTAIEISKGFDVVHRLRGEIDVPILALHGTGDKCTSASAVEDFFTNVRTSVKRKMFLKLPGMYHELLQEPETDQILKYITVFAEAGGSKFAVIDGHEKDGIIDVIFN